MPNWVIRLKAPLRTAIAAALIVGIGSMFYPNRYQSVARILPAEGKSAVAGGLGNLAAAAASFGITVPSSDGGDVNFVDILQSRWMGERLLETEYLFKMRGWRFGTENERRETLYSYLDVKNVDQALKKLGTVMMSSKDPKSRIVTISLETKSPTLSQQIVLRSIQLLEQFVREKGRTRGSEKAIFAEQRMRESRDEMGKVEADLRQFLEQNRNYQTSTDPAVRLRGMRLESELKLRQQLTTTIALNREQALMEEKNDIPIVNLLDSANLPIEKNSPNRTSWVFAVFAFVFLGAWGWDRREFLRELLRAD